eukprot:TRINITY_DN14987_c0_g1_i1.p1 TRINITY_DN14987_c0_g1~~TRINITY_DN14987_c0_g1_i1.p1  ORF type:complete len:407 (-),score=64.69 TRINITY_DN14987_c0_g1_i1:179-1399(-)
MVDATHLGLGPLLSGPLPEEEWPAGIEEAQTMASECVTLRRLSGETMVVKVAKEDSVLSVAEKAAVSLGVPAKRIRLVGKDSEILNTRDSAAELPGKEVDLIILQPSPKAITGSEDGTIHFWNLSDMSSLGELKVHRGVVWALDADIDAKRAISASGDTSLILWDLESMECIRSFDGHTGAVCAVSADFKSNWAISGSDDGTIRIWGFRKQTSIACLSLGSQDAYGTVWSLSADADRQKAVSGHEGGSVQVWDLHLGRCIHRFTEHHQGLVQVVAADFSALQAVSGSADAVLCLWDLSALTCLNRISLPQSMMLVWGTSRTFASEMKVLSGTWDGSLQSWDVKDGTCCGTASGPGVCSLAVDFAAQRAAVGTYGGELCFWDLSSMTLISRLEVGNDAIRSVVASFD